MHKDLSNRINAVPLTDLERAWFTDDELALRREVGPPKEMSITSMIGVAALSLYTVAVLMILLAIIGFGLFDLARWVISP